MAGFVLIGIRRPRSPAAVRLLVLGVTATMLAGIYVNLGRV
jgi:hypothetical protein